MAKLTQEQKREIEKIVENFVKQLEFENFKKELNSRENRQKFFAKFLTKEKIKDMTEYEFGELISNLWAFEIWTNKDYIVQKIIEENGFDKIRDSLIDLLFGDKPFEERFDNFCKEIKGLGPAAITEILCLYNPEEFSIWNEKTRLALKILNFKSLPIKKYKISGGEYTEINSTLKEFAQYLEGLLKNYGIEKVDLLTLDYLLYEIGKISKKILSVEEIPYFEEEDFDHDEIRDYIKNIGEWLGFDVETEKVIARGAKVDCIWIAKLANLGMVTYVFEVHKSGSIDSLILNLQKAINDPTVQKIIAVSNKSQLKKIENEVMDLPENFRKSLTFWEVKDVVNTYRNLSEAMKSISKLQLVKSRFEISEATTI